MGFVKKYPMELVSVQTNRFADHVFRHSYGNDDKGWDVKAITLKRKEALGLASDIFMLKG